MEHQTWTIKGTPRMRFVVRHIAPEPPAQANGTDGAPAETPAPAEAYEELDIEVPEELAAKGMQTIFQQIIQHNQAFIRKSLPVIRGARVPEAGAQAAAPALAAAAPPPPAAPMGIIPGRSQGRSAAGRAGTLTPDGRGIVGGRPIGPPAAVPTEVWPPRPQAPTAMDRLRGIRGSSLGTNSETRRPPGPVPNIVTQEQTAAAPPQPGLPSPRQGGRVGPVGTSWGRRPQGPVPNLPR
jgi:hypothetical protein